MSRKYHKIERAWRSLGHSSLTRFHIVIIRLLHHGALCHEGLPLQDPRTFVQEPGTADLELRSVRERGGRRERVLPLAVHVAVRRRGHIPRQCGSGKPPKNTRNTTETPEKTSETLRNHKIP